MDFRSKDALPNSAAAKENASGTKRKEHNLSRDFMLIQRNGLPKKGCSRSQLDLRNLELSTVPIDFEGVKIPQKQQRSVFPPNRTNADQYFVAPMAAMNLSQHAYIPTRQPANVNAMHRSFPEFKQPMSISPVSFPVNSVPDFNIVKPPDYHQVCHNPTYRQNLPVKRDSTMSSLNPRSSISSEESGTGSPSKRGSLLPANYRTSPSSPFDRRPTTEPPPYFPQQTTSNGRGNLVNFHIGDHDRSGEEHQQLQHNVAAVQVQATSSAITMQPARSFEVPKPVLQHTAVPAPLKAKKAGSVTPSKLTQFSTSPLYQTPSPTIFDGRAEPMRSPFSASNLCRRESQHSPRMEADIPRTASVETFISRSGSSAANFDSVGPLATGRCEPVVSARFRENNHDNNMEESQQSQVYRRSKYIAPNACKFYIEFHMENVIKYWDSRRQRRAQLESEMMQVNVDEALKEPLRAALNKRETDFLRERRLKMHRSNFTKMTIIGMGAFGEVGLVMKNDTGKYFAMKTLSKNHIVSKNQIAHVLAERDILAEADNEWVVKLYYSFQDLENLYLVMEYVPGGDLMHLLEEKGRFTEDWARFYTAELVCAIGSVHEMGFIHRDIKPDNILIDRKGHLKLTDFGLCTGFRWTHDSTNYDFYERTQDGAIHVRSDSMAWHKRGAPPPVEAVVEVNNKKSEGPRKGGFFNKKNKFAEEVKRKFAHSQVGTPNYMAPEVLMSSDTVGYTQVCDWWSVGVILYEMLCGRAPFYDTTPEGTQLKVMSWRSHLNLDPYQLSSSARDLILRLCCDADDRLGNGKSDLVDSRHRPITILGPLEIRSHPFFGGLGFSENIRNRASVFEPEIKHALDTSNFDKFNDADSPVEFWRKQENGNKPGDIFDASVGSQFYEFTFRRFFDGNFEPPGCHLDVVSASRDVPSPSAIQFAAPAVNHVPIPATNFGANLMSPPSYQLQAPPSYSAVVAPNNATSDEKEATKPRDHGPVYV